MGQRMLEDPRNECFRVDMDNVENIACSLVREYLSRKGFKSTLGQMDEEVPRTESSINSRIHLAKELHIEKLLRKNKESEHPYSAMVEVLTKFFLDKNHGNQTLNQSKMVSLSIQYPEDSPFMVNRSVQVPSESEIATPEGEPLPSSPSNPIHKEEKPKLQGSPKADAKIDENVLTHPEQNPMDKLNLEEPSLKEVMEKTAISYPFMGELEGTLAQVASETLTPPAFTNETPDNWPSPALSLSDKKVNKSGKVSNKVNSSYLSLYRRKKIEPDPIGRGDYKKNYSQLYQEQKTYNKSPPKLNSNRLGDLEIGEIDEKDYDFLEKKLKGSLTINQVAVNHGQSITLEIAMNLKQICFGSSLVNFSQEWNQQGFTFANYESLKFGLVQKKGGPCGLLASVQACILQVLLFGDGTFDHEPSLNVTEEQRTWCLATALTNILWKAGEETEAVVVLSSNHPQFPSDRRYKSDHFTESLQLFTFTSSNSLMDFVHQYIHIFEGKFSHGCILFLYSLILSRGMKRVIADMDEPSNKLIGNHGYCTQEMVNLILTGEAVSNVFNNNLEIDSDNCQSVLHGICSPSEIGFLTLYEHYNSCEVGSYLKNPLNPIWVICSESHFSVLFSLDKHLTSEKQMPLIFDLYYYDGLARQTEIIRLTVDISSNSQMNNYELNLIPPLDLCIRTKWKNACIDWNSTEPIL